MILKGSTSCDRTRAGDRTSHPAPHRHGGFPALGRDDGGSRGGEIPRRSPAGGRGLAGLHEHGRGLEPDAHGRGYGVEAATATIDYAFDVLGWTDVIHCIDPDNTPSQRLAERIGSRNLGPTRLPPPFQDLPIDRWGQSREAWRARPR